MNEMSLERSTHELSKDMKLNSQIIPSSPEIVKLTKFPNFCEEFIMQMCLAGLAPESPNTLHPALVCTSRVQNRRPYRSASDSTRLQEPKCHHQSLKSAADKAASLAAPKFWNKLHLFMFSHNACYHHYLYTFPCILCISFAVYFHAKSKMY